MNKAGIVALALALAGGAPVATHQDRPLYQDRSATVDRRVDDLLPRMTLEEKILLLGGDSTGFATQAIERLGIPAMTMTDGPVGVRFEKSTAFPAGVAMAATWDLELIGRVAGAIGEEAKAHGRDVLLGPCVNIQRVPQGGRNFESFGEDPYLAARMAVAYVQGLQRTGVVATPKHFAVNNQETLRMLVNARVDERTLREIYLPAFQAAVQEGGAWAVMSAYNKLNGLWCSENPPLLTDVLKRGWGFTGLVMSDWGGVHSAVPTAIAGCDLEMPRGDHLNAKLLLPAIQQGHLQATVVDDMVRRILRVMFTSGVFDRHGQPASGGALDTPAHRDLARDAAIEATVLLKNEGAVLPLEAAAGKTIAVIGPNAAIARTGGGGSSRVNPPYSVSPLEGIRKRVPAANVIYAAGCAMRGDDAPLDPRLVTPAGGPPGSHGFTAEYFGNPDLQGVPVATRVEERAEVALGRRGTGGQAPPAALPAGVNTESFSVRWTGTVTPDKTAEYEIGVRADDGVRVEIDGKPVIDKATLPRAGTQGTVALEANRAYPIRIEYKHRGGAATLRVDWRISDAELLREATQAARQADVALVFAGLSASYESEGFDRETLTLPDNQERLIEAVAAANRRTVVVLNSGAPIVMEAWVDRVPAVLEAWYPGQEAGNAAAALLFGDRSPSGRLPATFLKRWEDSPAYGHYPGANDSVEYAEGVFVGYRHFDQKNIEPRFPFGHGLSYTTFTYANLAVTPQVALSDVSPVGSGLQAGTSRNGTSVVGSGLQAGTSRNGTSVVGSGLQAGTSRIKPGVILVAFDVQNTGRREGAEVAQIYVSPGATSVARPPKELKAFRRVVLKPGERQRVSVTLDGRALAFYDAAKHDWIVEPGAYEVLVASSSRLIRMRGRVVVK